MNRRTLVLLLFLVPFPGCRDTTIEDGVAALNSTRIDQIYNCYTLYRNNNGYRGPKNQEELKKFLLQPIYERNLKLMQIDPENLDELFISERDGQPFKIRWSVNGWGDKALVFESVGVNGKRLVALSDTREVDDAEYDGLWSGKVKVETKLPNQDEGPQ